MPGRLGRGDAAAAPAQTEAPELQTHPMARGHFVTGTLWARATAPMGALTVVVAKCCSPKCYGSMQSVARGISHGRIRPFPLPGAWGQAQWAAKTRL